MRLHEVLTPSYVVDEGKLIENLKVLERVQKEAGCKILLAQKAFSMYSEYPLIGQYLSGTTASGLYEARLGAEEMKKENHVFSPAYKESEMDELAEICDHIIFNSVSQLERYGARCKKAGRLTQGSPAAHKTAQGCHEATHRPVQGCREAARSAPHGPSLGLRINPECSTQGEHAIYDPCAPGSRLGVTAENLKNELVKNAHVLDLIDGLHFHTLCEQNADDLATTLRAVEEKFGEYLHGMKWLNMGGGHHITRADYDVKLLISLVRHVRETYGVEVYLEPGEAVALDAGYLVSEVLDVVENGIKTLILDTSAACHMPDVLEMPYRPPLKDSGKAGEKAYTYRLSSHTCLAGDIIGDYSFDEEKRIGDRLYFTDMAIYSMVKNNTFNGIGLPSIYVMRTDGECELVKAFGYGDFKSRLS